MSSVPRSPEACLPFLPYMSWDFHLLFIPRIRLSAGTKTPLFLDGLVGCHHRGEVITILQGSFLPGLITLH